MMNKLVKNILVIACFVSLSSCTVQQRAGQRLDLDQKFVDTNLKEAVSQIKILAKNTPEDKMPKTFENNELKTAGTSWWTSGFYPGTLLYLYEYSKDPELLAYAKQKLDILKKEKDNKGTHDLGFMLYCSFGNAQRILGNNSEYQEVLHTGAESLSSRYSDKTKTIRSWDHGKWKYPVIIDNMMNLEFLMEMTKMTGEKKYRDIAINHANTTLENHFREDYSSYHVIDYDPDNGSVVRKATHQGASDKSSWARGQGWALYGYVMMYRETQNEAYLTLARNIAHFVLNHPNMPKDLVPYWDFDAPDFDADNPLYAYRHNRDVSAASLIASALIELSEYTPERSERSMYLKSAGTMLRSLSKAPYKSAYGDNGGFILTYSVGAIPLKSEIDVPLTYSDYYYIEALMRYNKLIKGEKLFF